MRLRSCRVPLRNPGLHSARNHFFCEKLTCPTRTTGLHEITNKPPTSTIRHTSRPLRLLVFRIHIMVFAFHLRRFPRWAALTYGFRPGLRSRRTSSKMKGIPTRQPQRKMTRNKSQLERRLPVIVVCMFFITLAKYLSDGSTETLSRMRTLRVRNGMDRDANLAFFIQTYSKSLPLMPGLIDAIWHPQNVYLIHVDAKVTLLERAPLQEFVKRRPYRSNVHFMASEPVSYMGITSVLNTINAMSILLNESTEWDYFFNLSGADYPLVSPPHMRAILGAPEVLGAELNFVQSFGYPKPISPQIYDSRFRDLVIDSSLWAPYESNGSQTLLPNELRPRLDTKSGLWRPKKSDVDHPLRNPKWGYLPMFKTEAWVILHRSFVDFVVHSVPSRRLLCILANILCPEEFFFGTLLSTSPMFRETAVFNAMRTVLWSAKKDAGSRPPDLDTGKIENVTGLLETSGGFFCRKLTQPVSDLKDFIDANILDMSSYKRGASDGPTRSSRYLERVRRRLNCNIKYRGRYELRKEYRICLKEGL